jgi:protein-S-isoprenylcysteine O-methyltransferase Ste14
MLFIYFLPSLLAFVRGHRRFFIILVLNVLLSPVQSSLLHFIWPGILSVNPHDLRATFIVAGGANLGPGWVVLLIWSLMPGEPDPHLLKAQQTKYYDIIAALPLVLWFAYGALQLRAILVHDASLMADGTAGLFIWVQFFSLLAAAAFDLLLVYLLVVRDRPIAKSRGVLPRFFGVVGTFMGVGILQLPVAHLDLSLQIFAALLIGLGSLGSLLVLWRLGRSFSIMPEARRLVTKGPYAWVRHPLYAMEMVTIAGTAVQFAAPWSWLIAFVVLALLWIRSRYEEQVLEMAYPEYGQYRSRTKRFIPGIV